MLLLTPLIRILALVLSACTAAPAPSPEVFRDEVSGFTVKKPAGWHLERGEALKERARAEAVRLNDPRLAPAPDGAPTELLGRITRFPAGQAPGPNPTIVFVRFDLAQFPAGVTPDDLLRVGMTRSQVEEEPATVTLAGRQWRRVVITRTMTHSARGGMLARQEVYVAFDGRWGIGLTLTAVPEQFVEHRGTFDSIVQTAELR